MRYVLLSIILISLLFTACQTTEVGLSYTILEEPSCDTCKEGECQALDCNPKVLEDDLALGEQQSI